MPRINEDGEPIDVDEDELADEDENEDEDDNGPSDEEIENEMIEAQIEAWEDDLYGR